MERYLPWLLLLAVALMPGTTFSQEVSGKQADEVLRQRAYKLLESLAQEIGSLQSSENRTRMGSNIAASLWTHNEPKAREMFATVTKEIKAALQDDDQNPNRYLSLSHFIKLREDTAVRLASCDPKWALQFLEETKPINFYISEDDQKALNFRLAFVFAGTNADLALQLGRESLKQGVSGNQLSLVYLLSKKSTAHASALFAEIVKIVPSQHITQTIENEQVYIMLARLVEPTLGSDPAFRELMGYFTDVALKAGCRNKHNNGGFCYRLGRVIPLMEKVNPKRVAPLKHLARRSAYPYESSPEMYVYADVYQTGSVDDLLATIPKYPEFRDAGEAFAIRKLLESGDFERARKLTNQLSWEPSDRQRFLKDIDEAQRIANQDTASQVFRDAEEFRNETDAFNYLFRKATEIGTKNRQTTLKLLDRATELLEKAPPEKWQMQYQIGIAVRYCRVKSDRCFTMMEPIIRRMNELVSTATQLDGFDNRYLSNGEWNMTAEGGVGSLLTMLAKNAVHFALSDFDRALALSSVFERREIRMMAQLKLAQGVLEGPPHESLFANDER
jgi:hypothetical protein